MKHHTERAFKITCAAIAAAVCTEYYGNGKARPADEALGCIPTVDRHGVGSPILASVFTLAMHKRAVKVGKLLRRVLGTRVELSPEGYALAHVDGVRYVIVDILFRMLRAKELAAAMGFPEDYAWPPNQRDTVQLIGNAVSVRQGRALILSVLPRSRAERRAATA